MSDQGEKLDRLRALLQRLENSPSSAPLTSPEKQDDASAVNAADSAAAARSCRETAIRYLCRDRGKGWQVVAERLRRAGFDEALITPCLQALVEDGYLDEDLAARRVIQRHSGRQSKGRLLLRQKMRQAGIREAVIEAHLSTLRSDSEALAELADYNLIPADRNKAYRFLCSRGFAPNAVMKFLQNEDELN